MQRSDKDLSVLIPDETRRNFKLLVSQVYKNYGYNLSMKEFLLFIIDNLEDNYYYNEELTVERLRNTKATIIAAPSFEETKGEHGVVITYTKDSKRHTKRHIDGRRYKVQLCKKDFDKLSTIAKSIDYRVNYGAMDVEDLISRAAQMFFDEHVDRKKGLEDLAVSYYRRHEDEILAMMEEDGVEDEVMN